MIITITLPEADEVLVQPGQKVDFETPILKRHSKKDIKVPLAQLLKIKSKDIFNHLKKFVGEEVTKNDLIAEVKGMLSTKRYFSEYEGVLKEINHGDGSITIAVKSDQDDIVIAFFKGDVHEVGKNELKLNVENAVKSEVKDVDDYFGGPAFYYTPQSAAIMTEDEVANRIIIADLIPSYDQVKLETLGIKGFVTVHTLNEKTGKPQAKLKNIQDLGGIINHKLPYCIIDKNSTTIYFYH